MVNLKLLNTHTNVKRCPCCNNKNTVNVIESIEINTLRKVQYCYFCSYCLTEFDDKNIKLFNSDGNSIGKKVCAN